MMHGRWKLNRVAVLAMASLGGLLTLFQNCAPMSIKAVESEATLSSAPTSCEVDGRTLATGETIVAYRSPSVPAGATCEAEARTCTRSILSGTAPYPVCVVDSPAAVPPLTIPPPLPPAVPLVAVVAPPKACGSHPFFESGTAPLVRYGDLATTSLNKLLVSGNYVWVITTCGVFRSADRGETFATIRMPGDWALVAGNNGGIYLDGDTLYFSIADRVYRQAGSGGAAVEILNYARTKALWDADAKDCTLREFPADIVFGAIWAEGNLVFATSSSTFTMGSTDGGVTWQRQRFRFGEYELPSTNAAEFIRHRGRILATYRMYAAYDGAKDASGRCLLGDETTAILGEKSRTVGVFQYQGDGRGFSLVPGSPGSSYPVTSNGERVATRAARPDAAKSISIFTPTTGVYESQTGENWSALAGTRANAYYFSSLAYLGEALWGTLYQRLYRRLPADDDFNQINLPDANETTIVNGAGNSLYVLTEKGLHVSRDGGQTFPKFKTFGSPLCGSNVLSAFDSNQFAGDGANLFMNRGYKEFMRTTDGGRVVATLRPRYEVVSQPEELIGAGPETLIARVGDPTNPKAQIIVSTDGGVSFAKSKVEYTVPGTTQTYRTTTGMLDQFGGFYLSLDGSNQISQIINVNGPNTLVGSAFSSGKRITATIKQLGVVTYENGVELYRGTDLVPVNTAEQIRLRWVDGVLFALGSYTYASYDQGRSFQKLPVAPARGVFKLGGSIVLAGAGAMNISSDGGRTFAPWTSCLR